MQWTNIEEVTTRPATQYYGQIPALKEDLNYAQESGTTVVLLLSDDKRAQAFSESLTDFEISIAQTQAVQKIKFN